MQASRSSGMHTVRSLHQGLPQGCDPLPVYGKIILLLLLKGEINHENKQKFLTILTLCIALLLTACGATDAAGTDKTNESLTETGTVSTDSSNTALDDLYQQENQLFADHEAVWNKVFGMMSKSNADPSGNYADYLADTVEANKGSFTDDEWKTLTDDIETIRKIEEQITELEQGTTTADNTAPETIPKLTLPSGISPVRILMVILSMKACFPPMQ